MRAEGKVEFSYYEDRAAWLKDTEGTGLTFDAARGVTVEQVEPLAYRVTYGKKSVVFALNDLSQIKTPAAALAPNDQFIGPVFINRQSDFFSCSMGRHTEKVLETFGPFPDNLPDSALT